MVTLTMVSSTALKQLQDEWVFTALAFEWG